MKLKEKIRRTLKNQGRWFTVRALVNFLNRGPEDICTENVWEALKEMDSELEEDEILFTVMGRAGDELVITAAIFRLQKGEVNEGSGEEERGEELSDGNEEA